MLDKKDHANIKYKRVNSETGKEVEWKNIVKGYKYEGEYVVLTDDDFEKASPEKSKTIAIEEFVDEEQLDPIYFETPYYLEPAKGGERAYALLREALRKSKKVAIGVFVLRSKESLCVLRPSGPMLMLVRMRFAEEIRDYETLDIPSEKVTIKPAELKMAQTLIDQLTTKEFDIAKYKDNYDKELLKLVKAKASGKEIAVPKTRVHKTKAIDLMAQLKESLEQKKHKKAS